VTVSFSLSRRAQSDLDSIWNYSASRWGVIQADAYVRQLISLCSDLGSGRAKGLPVHGVKAEYLKYSVVSHVIFYRPRKPSGVAIVRILHQSMDVDRHL
jgi:toxin ParE1/3/4